MIRKRLKSYTQRRTGKLNAMPSKGLLCTCSLCSVFIKVKFDQLVKCTEKPISPQRVASSAKRPAQLTYQNVVHSRTKIFFASYSTGLKLSSESGARIFLQFLKNTAQERPSPIRLGTVNILTMYLTVRCPWVYIYGLGS